MKLALAGLWPNSVGMLAGVHSRDKTGPQTIFPVLPYTFLQRRYCDAERIIQCEPVPFDERRVNLDGHTVARVGREHGYRKGVCIADFERLSGPFSSLHRLRSRCFGVYRRGRSSGVCRCRRLATLVLRSRWRHVYHFHSPGTDSTAASEVDRLRKLISGVELRRKATMYLKLNLRCSETLWCTKVLPYEPPRLKKASLQPHSQIRPRRCSCKQRRQRRGTNAG